MTQQTDRLNTALAGHYTIERELGAGGMATVFLAEDLKHHRQVAIKVLRPDLAAALGADRFMQEIEIAARLQHPHILGVHDSGSADGFLYYVMPYVEGESLRERLARQGELPVHDAVRMLVEIADALAHAHSRGVVHRDIKPENVMLSGRHALVMDFGVAKAVNEASGRNKLTTLGVALGTPAYMAPEQATADPLIDHRVDIYALGVMGYELLAGRPPFTGASPQQVLAAHVTQLPDPVNKYRPQLSPALAHVIMKALEKRAADRWQSAEEMLKELEPQMTPSGGLTPAETRPYAAVGAARRWPRFVAVGVGGAVVVAAAVWWMNRPPATAALAANVQLTRAAGVEEFPIIAPDGKSVAYFAFPPTDTAAHVELRRTDGGDAVQIAGASRPVGWSPTGDRLLMRSNRGVEARPVLGGQSTVVSNLGFSACWSADAQHIAYVAGDSLFIGGPYGESPRFVAQIPEPHSPVWSPDGKWIALVSGNKNYFSSYNIAPSRIWIVPAAGGTPVPLTAADGASMSPTWAPDSRRLLMVSTFGGARDVYQLNLGGDGRPRGPVVRISTGLNPSLISLSADGTQLAYSVATYHTNIWKAEIPKSGVISTRGALPVTNDRQTIEALDVSRDGRWLVFDSNREGVQQLFKLPLAGGAVQQITRSADPSFKPVTSPDGTEIVYHVTSGLQRHVFVVGIDGGKPVQVSPGTAPDERNANWSPDGRRIAWMVPNARYSTSVLYAWDVQVASRRSDGTWGAAKTVVFHGPQLTPAWADAGTSLVAIDSSWHYVAEPIDGGAPRRLGATSVADSARVRSGVGLQSSDGRSIYFAQRAVFNGDGRGRIVELRLADGTTREVLRFDEPARPHNFSSNGIAEHAGWMYFTLSDLQSDIWLATVTGLKK